MPVFRDLEQRFTPSAATAWRAAERQVVELRHGWFGTEHLLLGLLADPGEPTARLLAEHGARLHPMRARLRELDGPAGAQNDEALLATLGVDLAAVRNKVTAAFGPDAVDELYARRRRGRRRLAWGPLCGQRVMPRLKLALAEARKRADARRSTQVTPSELLAGLLSVEDSMAVRLLLAAGVDVAALRSIVDVEGVRHRSC